MLHLESTIWHDWHIYSAQRDAKLFHTVNTLIRLVQSLRRFKPKPHAGPQCTGRLICLLISYSNQRWSSEITSHISTPDEYQLGVVLLKAGGPLPLSWVQLMHYLSSVCSNRPAIFHLHETLVSRLNQRGHASAPLQASYK